MFNYFIFPLIFFIAAVGQVHAADTGFCSTPETMTATLKAEGQRSIASAQSVLMDKQMRGMMFTMNADRSVGYILRADKPLGEHASQICVQDRLSDIRLFDARQPGIPTAVLLKAPEADAQRQCAAWVKEKRVVPNGCGSLNTMIAKIEKWGVRVMMQGLVTEKGPDGTYRTVGTLATISGHIGGRVDTFKDSVLGVGGDLLYSSLPDGATVINVTLIYPEYTPYGLEQISR
ncbi:hypothetical protein ACO0LM_22245 [Undibacterium sp. Di26W]|uniref:hypothetical protein n=1 Tax=Undibacterium sp. Di26W TaxID=3413035 RepID=UPI003BF3BDB7